MWLADHGWVDEIFHTGSTCPLAHQGHLLYKYTYWRFFTQILVYISILHQRWAKRQWSRTVKTFLQGIHFTLYPPSPILCMYVYQSSLHMILLYNSCLQFLGQTTGIWFKWSTVHYFLKLFLRNCCTWFIFANIFEKRPTYVDIYFFEKNPF